ncbi:MULTISPECIES: hemerythrin domain-containing protein [unclassified Plantactinospora]|uniref:hemerythrin domain-containing protein n=1 Tax=unclassified Plantactinospora TaxID=2631981 RepID=UPI000D172DF6|nr:MULTISPECIES: hemerythrin domain-containing protein [unclassified Plantactinospora]AVT34036.1 hemerythrin [Plantactinospora sp. BC1]AVT41679.1 hemerythrin [Plantactinospora sp. BB1]
MTAGVKQDVLDLLIEQHKQIKTLFSQLGRAEGSQKRELFQDLVRLLAVHETAEEIVVHPTAQRKIERGDTVTGQLRHEEDEAKKELAALYDLGVDHPEFDRRLAKFAEAVSAHAIREENEEFPSLRRSLSSAQLGRMAGALRAAEAMAPTRPHPHAGESASANLMAGPPLAVFDRMRDAVRDWRESQRGQD